MDLAIGLDATIGADAADPATRILADGPRPRFVEGLDGEALQGARIGVLTALFGDAGDDREHALIVRAALDSMSEAGAEIIDVEIPGLDSLLSGSSLIGLEFKWDLIDYLAATPAAPVSSLQDLLDRGLYHVRLEGTFRRRAAQEERDSAAYARAMDKRAAARDAVVARMDELLLDVLAYPTIRRRAARIGDPQGGSNCQLSADDWASGVERSCRVFRFRASHRTRVARKTAAGRTIVGPGFRFRASRQAPTRPGAYPAVGERPGSRAHYVRGQRRGGPCRRPRSLLVGCHHECLVV